MGKYLEVDGVEYPVAIIELKRKGDILDKTANRTEDGDLHREVIGTYYNYSMKIRPGTRDRERKVYNALYWVLTAPVPYHEVKLPNETETVKMYFGSVQDEIKRIDENGEVYYSELSCNLVCKLPRRYANG